MAEEQGSVQLAGFPDLAFTRSLSRLASRCDLRSENPADRARGWAAWVLQQLRLVNTGHRTYLAIRLPGRFYVPDPSSAAAAGLKHLVPHLEVPPWVQHHPPSDLGERVAGFGNLLLFDWWTFPEVVAVRRALFSKSPAPSTPFLQALQVHRPQLVNLNEGLRSVVLSNWGRLHEAFYEQGDRISDALLQPWTPADITRVLPDLDQFEPHMEIEGSLVRKLGTPIRKAAGVWRFRGTDPDGHQFLLGVGTPRLTKSSLTEDVKFAAPGESTPALLARALVLQRVLAVTLHIGPDGRAIEPNGTSRTWKFTFVEPRPGAKLPIPSPSSIVRLFFQFPDPTLAWNALQAAAGEKVWLTVTEDEFRSAYQTLGFRVRRNELELPRDLLEQVFPVAWDADPSLDRPVMGRMLLVPET